MDTSYFTNYLNELKNKSWSWYSTSTANDSNFNSGTILVNSSFVPNYNLLLDEKIVGDTVKWGSVDGASRSYVSTLLFDTSIGSPGGLLFDTGIGSPNQYLLNDAVGSMPLAKKDGFVVWDAMKKF